MDQRIEEVVHGIKSPTVPESWYKRCGVCVCVRGCGPVVCVCVYACVCGRVACTWVWVRGCACACGVCVCVYACLLVHRVPIPDALQVHLREWGGGAQGAQGAFALVYMYVYVYVFSGNCSSLQGANSSGFEGHSQNPAGSKEVPDSCCHQKFP